MPGLPPLVVGADLCDAVESEDELKVNNPLRLHPVISSLFLPPFHHPSFPHSPLLPLYSPDMAMLLTIGHISFVCFLSPFCMFMFIYWSLHFTPPGLSHVILHYLSSNPITPTLSSYIFYASYSPLSFSHLFLSSLDSPFPSPCFLLTSQRLLEIFRDDLYVISIRKQSKTTCEIHLLLKEKASKKDLLLGLIHAFIVRYSLKCRGYHDASKLKFMIKFNRIQRQKVTESTYDILVRTRILINKSSNSIKNESELNPMNSINVDDIREGDNEMDMKKKVSVGLSTVEKVLNSQWLVEELLLETRHARLVIV